MAYELTLEEVSLPNHNMVLDVVIEIDDGRAGEWYIESMYIPANDKSGDDIDLKRTDLMFKLIEEAIRADSRTVAYIDAEAEENNTESLAYTPSWY
jgi:hypothetical protein